MDSSKLFVRRTPIRALCWLSVTLCAIPAGLAFALASQSPEAAKRGRPITFAILVGNNKGHPQDRPLRYAQSDTKRVSRVMRELGGVLPQRTYVLLDRPRAGVLEAFDQIERSIKKHHQRNPRTPTMLLFYYSGHADAQALHLGRTEISFKEIRQRLKRSKAQVRLAVLDTCQSGNIIRNKGARRTTRHTSLPPVFRDLSTRGEAIITSSGVGEDSHELDQLRGSIFTHYLLSGMRGAADLNRDQRVSLYEAYSYAYQRTRTHTLFLSTGLQRPSFRNALQGHGHITLTYLQKASAKLDLGPQLQGTYYVLNRQQNRLLAEVAKKKGSRMTLGLAAGQYTLVQRARRKYRIQRLSLRQGQRHNLRPTQMRALAYTRSVQKGVSWLVDPHKLAQQAQTPYRTAFHTALGLTAAGLVSTGVLYGLSQSYYSGAQQSVDEQNGRGDVDRSMLETSANLNTGAIVAIGFTLSAGLAATLFYVLDQKKMTRPSPQKLPAEQPLLGRQRRDLGQRTLYHTP